MDKSEKPASRLTSSKTFPVNLNHRHHRSEVRAPKQNQSGHTGHNYSQSQSQSQSQNLSRGAPEERQPWPRRLFIDTSDLEPTSAVENTETETDQSKKKPTDHKRGDSHEKSKSHRYSKSREYRFPRAVNQIASAGGARNLLPTRTPFHRHGHGHSHSHSHSHGHGHGHGQYAHPFFGGERDTELGFLKPTSSSTHQDSSRSRFGSRSSSAHRNDGSQGTSFVVTEGEDNEALSHRLAQSTVRKKGITTTEDLGLARQEREKGEEILRLKLASIGTVATDITRRLDFTYYNLLERISTLHSTIHSFQDLVDSSAALHENLQRDNSNIESEIHRQLTEVAKFEPQRRRIEELERRMKVGRSTMHSLGERLDKVRGEIEGWERREGEWQARVSRRLRLLFAFISGLALAIVVAYFAQSWRLQWAQLQQSDLKAETRSGSLHTPELHLPGGVGVREDFDVDVDVDVEMKTFIRSPRLAKTNISTGKSEPDTQSEPTQSEIGPSVEQDASSTDTPSQDSPPDPLYLFDEL